MNFKLTAIALLALPVMAQAALPPLTQDPIDPAAKPAQIFKHVDQAAPLVKAKQAAVHKSLQAHSTSAPGLQQQQADIIHKVQELDDRFTQFGQAYVLTQQENKQQMEILQQKTMAVQAEIEQLVSMFKSLNQDLEQMKSTINAQQQKINQLNQNGMQNISQRVADVFADQNNILLLLLVVVLMLALWLARRLRKHRALMQMQAMAMSVAASGGAQAVAPIKAPVQADEDDTKNEYDFMGSSEGIPAQLDLARAYIAMENYKDARKVLAQVMTKGDANQQQQAKALLMEIPAGQGE
jgi:FimV-like protein